MDREITDILVDPIGRSELRLDVRKEENGEIVNGELIDGNGEGYPIVNGIPRFVLTEDEGQRQTEDSFAYKWEQRDTYESEAARSRARDWLVERYGFADADEMRAFFGNKKWILDAGCGSGFRSSLWLDEGWKEYDAEWIGVDISEAIDVAKEALGHLPRTHFLQADVLELPFQEDTFDAIFSEGVLHHTPSTERALKALVPLLKDGAELMFYVYRKKGPIREFVDDHVRDVVSSLPPEEAWEKLRSLTKLGRALAEMDATVEVEEDIPYLGVEAGSYDIQRFFYWNVAKVFWNEDMSFEENHHINFDWYHPDYAHRQTKDEVVQWCEESGLGVTHMDVQRSGITVRAVKEG